MRKLIIAIVLALALTTGKLARQWNTSIHERDYQVTLDRPAPIDWGKDTPNYYLITDSELSAHERILQQEN